MEDCKQKWLILIVCIIVVLFGLYLTLKREQKNIDTGNADLQDGGGSLKDGTFNFKFAIGVVVILIGLGGAYFSIKNLPGCDQNQRQTLETAKDTVPTVHVNCGDEPLNKRIGEKLVAAKFVLRSTDAKFEVECNFEPAGEPSHVLKNKTFFYYYDSTEVTISINKSMFGLRIYVPQTEKKQHIPEAKNEYKALYLKTVNDNFDTIYASIKSNLR